MARLIRMDSTGHSTLAEWTPATTRPRVKRRSRQFRRELDEGYIAVVNEGAGQGDPGARASARRRPRDPAPPDRRRLTVAVAAPLPELASVPWRPAGRRRLAPPPRAALDCLDRRCTWCRSWPPGSGCCCSSRSRRRWRSWPSPTPGSSRSCTPSGARAWSARRDAPRGRRSRWRRGCLGDLLGHDERELQRRAGLALERGALGAWLVGEGGALLVAPGGRRVHCFCVRATDAELPPSDRIAHLLLALRSDEAGLRDRGEPKPSPARPGACAGGCPPLSARRSTRLAAHPSADHRNLRRPDRFIGAKGGVLGSVSLQPARRPHCPWACALPCGAFTAMSA